MNVYALTPTGARPEGLALLGEYLNAQTYRGPMTWVIVDDCDPATRVPRLRPEICIEQIRPSWRWQLGQNTQVAALNAGLAVVPQDALLIVLEDDDIYLPQHVDNVLRALEGAELVGERLSRYYNVSTGRSRALMGRIHASLASTACRGSALQAIKKLSASNIRTAFDVTLWKNFNGSKRLLDSTNVVGIKGLAGRAGIGIGHRPTFGTRSEQDVLRQWAGDYADNYELFRRAG